MAFLLKGLVRIITLVFKVYLFYHINELLYLASTVKKWLLTRTKYLPKFMKCENFSFKIDF